MTDEELVKRIFEDDGYVKLSGLEIVKISADHAIVRANIGKEHCNAMGNVQGGMLYTLADFAFAVQANYLHPITVTQGGHINYIRAAATNSITTVAKETIRSGHNTISEVIIYDDKNEVCCVCSFNGFVKDMDKEELKKQYSQK
jgi:acyl-CoA thioesterase